LDKTHIVFGNINLDIIAQAPKIPAPDSSIRLEKLTISVGGGAVNYSVAVSRLGDIPFLAGKTGKEFRGLGFSDILRKEKVRVDFVRYTRKKSIGISIILNIDYEPRRILFHRGANLLIDKKMIISVLKKAEKPDIIHIASLRPWVVREVYNFYLSINNRPLISYDPGSETKYILKELQKHLHLVDILLINEEEYHLVFRNKKDFKNFLVNNPNMVVVVKRGKKGGTVYYKNATFSHKPPKLKIIDTTGSGDAFNAAFNVCFLEKNDLEECIKWAVTNGTLKATRLGSISSPSRKELFSLLRNLPR